MGMVLCGSERWRRYSMGVCLAAAVWFLLSFAIRSRMRLLSFVLWRGDLLKVFCADDNRLPRQIWRHGSKGPGQVVVNALDCKLGVLFVVRGLKLDSFPERKKWAYTEWIYTLLSKNFQSTPGDKLTGSGEPSYLNDPLEVDEMTVFEEDARVAANPKPAEVEEFSYGAVNHTSDRH